MVEASPIQYAWILVGITSLVSILGSLTIYVDVIWNAISKRHFSILHSNGFLGTALSLSCGTLLITGLNALLPKSVVYILEARPDFDKKRAYTLVVPSFLVGAVLCLFLNFIVLRFAANSVAPCPHNLDTVSRSRKSIVQIDHEHLPLLQTDFHDHGAVRSEINHRQDIEHNGCAIQDYGNDSDYAPDVISGTHSSEHLSSHHNQTHSHDVDSYDHSHDNLHEGNSHEGHSLGPHNHVANLKQKSAANLLSIGLQTTLGISVHRLPEGLLLFATTATDRELGLSLVMALSIHSFGEGFSVAAPLYAALKRRSYVVALSALLVCGPQLVGAYIGSRIFVGGGELTSHSLLVFGLCMAGTAGFMLVVCVQMISSAFRYMSQKGVLAGVLAGALFSLASRMI